MSDILTSQEVSLSVADSYLHVSYPDQAIMRLGAVVEFMQGDTSATAVGYRMRLARNALNLTQNVVGDAGGITRTAVTNIEGGGNYPSVPLMRWFYKEHRVDFNYLINGDYAQLPADVLKLLRAQEATVKPGEEDEPAA